LVTSVAWQSLGSLRRLSSSAPGARRRGGGLPSRGAAGPARHGGAAAGAYAPLAGSRRSGHAPGDRLRFRVASARPGWLAVLSIDGAGAVSAYAPSRGPLLPLAAGAGQLLEGSTELDATPGPERLIAVRCDSALPAETLVTGLRQALAAAGGAAARVDPERLGCAATSFWIDKAPPR
jgi:hypothetical protein